MTFTGRFHIASPRFTCTCAARGSNTARLTPTANRNTACLLAYNFNWQLTYYLQQPKVPPKGTVLECIARFDNSPNNLYNPDPTKEIWWGDQTWDEMSPDSWISRCPSRWTPSSRTA